MSCGNCKSNVNSGGNNANADRAGCRYCRNFDCKCRKHPYEENGECNCVCICGCIQPRYNCGGYCERGFDDGFSYDNCFCASHNNVNNCVCKQPRSNCERGYDDGYRHNGCNGSDKCGNSGQKEFYDRGYERGFIDGRGYNRGCERGFDDGFSHDGCGNPNVPAMHNSCTSCGCNRGCGNGRSDYEKGYERGFDDGFSTDRYGNPNVPAMHNSCTSCGCNGGCNGRCGNGCNNGCNHRNRCGCNHC